MVIDHRLGQGECLAVVMIEALRNIPRHLNMLNLVAADRHLVGIKNQNISSHQYGVGKQTHGDPKVGVLAGFFIGLHGGFVGVSPVHQTFCCRASQHPAQLGDLGDIGLAVEVGIFWIETQRQPGCRDLATGLCHFIGILVLD